MSSSWHRGPLAKTSTRHPTAGELRGAETISATALGERELVLHGEAVREREGEAGRLERAVRCSGDEFSSWFLHIDDGRRSTEYTEIRRQAGTNNYQYLSYLSYPLRTALPLGPARRSIPPLCSEPAPEALQAPARGTPQDPSRHCSFPVCCAKTWQNTRPTASDRASIIRASIIRASI